MDYYFVVQQQPLLNKMCDFKIIPFCLNQLNNKISSPVNLFEKKKLLKLKFHLNGLHSQNSSEIRKSLKLKLND